MSATRPATILDVAHHAGVSRATVSLVLQDSPRISDATKARVRESIVQLKYRYNRGAASLRSTRSMTVGLVLADVRNSYFADVSMVVQSRLQAEGYGLIVGYTLDDPRQQQNILGAMAEQRVDGLILLPAPATKVSDLQLVRNQSTPLALIGRRVDGLDADFVSTDNPFAARQLGSHLASLGVRRAALLGGASQTSSFTDRVEGLAAGLGDPGALGAYPTAATFEGGMAAARQLLDEEPEVDAVVAYTDTVALGIYEELRSRGIQPGVDIAIATFDDSVVTRLLDPPLTTIATFPHNIGGETVSLLLTRLQSPSAPARTVTVAPELKVAASTAGWRPRTR